MDKLGDLPNEAAVTLRPAGGDAVQVLAVLLRLWERARRALRSWKVCLALAVVFVFREKLCVLLRAWKAKIGPAAAEVVQKTLIGDPLLPVKLPGVTFREAQDFCGEQELWEWWMDSLGFDSTSPVRPWLKGVFGIPEWSEHVDLFFARLDSRQAGCLCMEDALRCSEAIKGDIRGILKKHRLPLLRPNRVEVLWVTREFDQIFPEDEPLDALRFRSLFKLIMVRRVIRTLTKHTGLARLRTGFSKPVVMNLWVQVGPDDGTKEIINFHTIAPVTKASSCGQRLGLIQEVPSPRGSDVESDVASNIGSDLSDDDLRLDEEIIE